MFLDNTVSSGSPFNIYSACQNEVQYILFYTVHTKHVSLLLAADHLDLK